MTRARGPFSRAKREQIAGIRALVVAYAQWERTQGTPGQTLTPVVPSSARSGTPAHIERHIADRAAQRIRERPDAADIAATHRLLYLRAHRPEVWREEQAALHLAGIHNELTRIRVALELGTAHVREDREDI